MSLLSFLDLYSIEPTFFINLLVNKNYSANEINSIEEVMSKVKKFMSIFVV